MSLDGLDTSSNNPGVPDAIITADFIFFKATEGIGYTDSDCNASYQEALAAGKKVGVYHFARFDGNSPEDEAIWFNSQIQGYLGTAMLMLDLEVNPITPDLAKRFLDKLYELTKVRAVLYMSLSRYNSQDWSALMPNYGAFPAAYGANNPQTGYGAPQAGIAINGDWVVVGLQYTSNGYLAGYGNRLDFDIFYGDANTWAKYAQGDRNVPAPVVIDPPVVVVPPVVVDVPVVTPTPDPIPVVVLPVVTPVIPVVSPISTPQPILDPTPAPVKENFLIAFLQKVIQFLIGYNFKK